MKIRFKCAIGAPAVLVALLLITSPTLAQTESTVCDLESGAAYGLCNAYCEAMDCDSDSPRAAPVACARVMDKWNQQTASRIMPCELVATTPDDGSFRTCPFNLADLCAAGGGIVSFYFDPNTGGFAECSCVDSAICVDRAVGPDEVPCSGTVNEFPLSVGGSTIVWGDQPGQSHFFLYCNGSAGDRECTKYFFPHF